MNSTRLVSKFISDNLVGGNSSGSFPATVLLADMAGFTRLTDEAMRRGDGGAEWISNILSRTFSPFIDFVQQEGGFIAEFEGDAALAVFPGERFELLERVQALLEETSRKIGEHVSFSVASGSGILNWGVGGSDGILYQLFHGTSIADLFKLDCKIPSSAVWQSPTEERFGFSPAILAEKEFGGEFRNVFSAFLSVKVSSVEEAQSFFESVCSFTSTLDGFLSGTHLRSNEATALVVFGAPTAHETDARRCCELIFGLQKYFPALSAGITGGSAYAGFVGSGARCAYTVLGSTVNLSSRLCGKAKEGEILVNDHLSNRIEQYFSVGQSRTIQLKGFTEPQICYGITDSIAGSKDDFFSGIFVGRERELKELQEQFSECCKKSKLTVVNTMGEPGIGKSRLLCEFFAGYSPQTFTLVLSGDELTSTLNLHSWEKALESLPEYTFSDILQNTEPGEERHELLRAEKYLTPVLNSSEDIVSDENLAYSVSVLLDYLAQTGEFLIGVENPHLIAPESLSILESFINRQISTRVMVISTCRKKDQIPDFLKSANMINLGPFSVEETIEKLSVDIGFPVRGSIAEILHQRSSGNPLYLEELSCIVNQNQMNGTWSTWQDMEHLLPYSLSSLLENRIDQLSEEMREAVSFAAVLGADFDSEILRHMLPVRSTSITRGMSLGIWKISGRGKLSFRHHLLRETAYKMLLVSKRKKIHRLVAKVVLSLYPEPEGEQLLCVALNAAGADDEEIALRYLETAGDHCRQAHKNQVAIDLYTDLERLTPDPNTGMRARGKKGAVLEVVGRWYEALELYRTSISIADADSAMAQDSCRMRISLGRLLMQQGSFDDAIEVLEKAREFVKEQQELLLGSIYANLGGSWLRKREFGKAASYLNQWREIIERADDKHSLAMAMGLLGVLAEETGELEEAEKYYLSQAELAEETGQDFVASISFQNLGSLALQSGDLDLAESYFQKKLAIAEKLGHRSSESLAMGSLSRVYCYKENYDKALEFANFNLKVCQVLSNRFREVSATTDVFTVQLYSGNYKAAEKTIDDRKSMIKAMKIENTSSETYYMYGLLEMFREDFNKAIRSIELSIKSAESDSVKIDALSFSILGLLHMLIGDIPSGVKFLGRAEEESPAEGNGVIDKLSSLINNRADPILRKRVNCLISSYSNCSN